jgi:hypothetical protein
MTNSFSNLSLCAMADVVDVVALLLAVAVIASRTRKSAMNERLFQYPYLHPPSDPTQYYKPRRFIIKNTKKKKEKHFQYTRIKYYYCCCTVVVIIQNKIISQQ